MQTIDTHGISNLLPLNGDSGWYWGSDYAQGDLYEAEELYRDHHPVTCNRLVFVHYPDGRVIEPIQGRAGQYFGRPIFHDGNIQILLTDFPRSLIQIVQYDDAAARVIPVAALPLAQVQDCYNLLLHSSPLMLTRQANDKTFQILWPEQVAFAIEETETFLARQGDRLYFCRWYELPDTQDYREETVVRHYPDGTVLDVIPGTWMELPDGQVWILR